MSGSAASTPIAIRGVGLVSPIGVGFDAFRQSLASGDAWLVDSTNASFAGKNLPNDPAAVVENFDVRHYLGSKGVSAFDRTTQLSVVACGQALEHAGLSLGDEQDAIRRGVGVVVGTAGGSLKSISDFVHSTYDANPPYMISAMQFPNTVMNCAASQCAIWHRLRGVNSTVCAGRLSGLSALQYASRMLRLRHAHTLVAGAVEEYCDFTAWGKAAFADDSQAPLGEGAALFVLSLPEEHVPSLAQLLSVRIASGPCLDQDPAGFAHRYQACIQHALAQAGVQGEDIAWWSAQLSGPQALDEAEQAGVNACLGHALEPIAVARQMGQSYSAGASFQLAALLATAPSGLGIVTALSAQGQLGCAVVRMAQAGGQA